MSRPTVNARALMFRLIAAAFASVCKRTSLKSAPMRCCMSDRVS